MALLCLLYFTVVGAALATAASLAERALPRTAPRRWLWIVAMLASIVGPMVMSVRHSSPVVALWGVELLRLPAQAPGGPAAAGWTQLLDCGSTTGQRFLRLWFIGIPVLLGWGAASAWRLRRLVRAGRAARGDRDMVVDGVAATLTDSIGPATMGLWRGRVLLPRWVLALPAPRRRYVARHEQEHVRARDALLLAAASLLVALMPWNAALWWQLRRLHLAVELDCDQRVLARLGDPIAYGELLVSVAEAASRGPRLRPALLDGPAMLERRLVALLDSDRSSALARRAAPVLLIAILAALLSLPHPEMAPQPGTTTGHAASHARAAEP